MSSPRSSANCGALTATPISGFRTIDDVRNAAVRPWRLMMALVSVFAGLALLLAAVGIYGVISYQVESRRHEMGVLLALGATAGDIIRTILGRELQPPAPESSPERPPPSGSSASLRPCCSAFVPLTPSRMSQPHCSCSP